MAGDQLSVLVVALAALLIECEAAVCPERLDGAAVESSAMKPDGDGRSNRWGGAPGGKVAEGGAIRAWLGVGID